MSRLFALVNVAFADDQIPKESRLNTDSSTQVINVTFRTNAERLQAMVGADRAAGRSDPQNCLCT